MQRIADGMVALVFDTESKRGVYAREVEGEGRKYATFYSEYGSTHVCLGLRMEYVRGGGLDFFLYSWVPCPHATFNRAIYTAGSMISNEVPHNI